MFSTAVLYCGFKCAARPLAPVFGYKYYKHTAAMLNGKNTLRIKRGSDPQEVT